MENKKTFIMLKPDAIRRGLVFESLTYFFENGFRVEAMDILSAEEEMVLRHYAEVIEKLGPAFAQKLQNYMQNKMVVPMVLYREDGDAIALARKILGATDPSKAEKGTIRGDLGVDSYEKCNAEGRSCENLVHASDSLENARREAAIWLPRYPF